MKIGGIAWPDIPALRARWAARANSLLSINIYRINVFAELAEGRQQEKF